MFACFQYKHSHFSQLESILEIDAHATQQQSNNNNEKVKKKKKCHIFLEIKILLLRKKIDEKK